MSVRHDQETRDRVVRMFLACREEVPSEPRSASNRMLHDLTDIPIDTMRGWVDRARVDAGEKVGMTTGERVEVEALRKELAEVKRAKEILKTASASFTPQSRSADSRVASGHRHRRQQGRSRHCHSPHRRSHRRAQRRYGHARLIERLTGEQGIEGIVLEATGGHERACAFARLTVDLPV